MESEDDESSGGILGGSGLSHDLDDDRGQEIDKIELINIVKLLGSKLEDLQTCHDLIVKHGLALQRSLGKEFYRTCLELPCLFERKGCV